ncbi:MAG TPA: tetratricopeptide repeat protein [Polyangiales bacterium]|nr:tetratricopeptide repeat protein [Polyangiales bacterium]
MSAPHNDHDQDVERYLELADREASDESLSADEQAFCRAFERRYPADVPELAVYAELAELNAAPDDASRALVDRTLAQIEAEDAARASEDVKRLRGRKVPGFVLVVAAAAFALGSGYALLQRTPGSGLRAATGGTNPLARAELVYTSGTVKISDTNGAAGRTLLSEGSTIETQSGAACVLIDSDINICLAPQSKMRLRAIASMARVVDLEAGKLATRLATQPEGMSLSIVAAGVSSTAIGTAFSVERSDTADHGDDGHPEVTTVVLNGKVRVGRDAEVAVVSAHERAVSQTRGPAVRPIVTSVSRTEEAPSWALLGPTVLWHDPVAATLEVHGQPAGAEAWLDDQWLGVTPVTSLIPAGEHRLSVRVHNREIMGRDLYVHAGDTQAIGYTADRPQPAPANSASEEASVERYYDREDVRSPSHSARRARHREHGRASYRANREPDEPAVVQEAEAEAENGGGLGLRQARQAMRAGQFRAAAAIYEQLAEGGASQEEASTAMVLLGQLRLNQLGDPKGALAPLNAYLKRGGPIAVEARAARIEALRRLNRTADETAAIEEFLRLHPRNFEVNRLQVRLETLRNAKH